MSPSRFVFVLMNHGLHHWITEIIRYNSFQYTANDTKENGRQTQGCIIIRGYTTVHVEALE